MMEGAEGFDAKSCQLPQLPLEVWHGFIFVNADPTATPLSAQIGKLEPLVKDYEMDNLVVVDTLYFDSPWNWKLLVENFTEAYHHIGAHKNTFEPVYPARDSFAEDNDGQPWSFLRMPGVAPADGEPSSFPNLADERRNELFAAAIFPTFLFAASNASGAWYQLEPTGAGEMKLYIHALAHKDLAAQMDDHARQQMRDFLTVVHTEDIAVNAGPWRGLQAGLTKQGRLSPFEKTIWQLNQYWAQRLGL
jgi:phenylpropionate dioxygenase-like ring-hydroxylating dioxygenase large terminal subunit